MKFRLGPPPEDESFARGSSRWHLLQEPGIWSLQLIGLAAAVAVVAVILAVLLMRSPGKLPDVSWLAVIVLFVPSIPIHEFLHASLFPGGPMSRRVTIGFFPKALGFYAYYDGTMSRRRYIFILLWPFLLLTVVPLTIKVVFMPEWPYLVELILTNGLLSAVDILTIISVAKQVPSRSMLINVGTRTYWSDSEKQAQPGENP